MIISVNWLKKFVDITMPVSELATLIGARLVEIESTENLSAKYKDVIIASVVECVPIEGTDHLNVTKIDDSGVVENVERDENGLVQVVCGAPNVRAGITIAWLPPGSIVPETFGDADPFVLGAKSLRGVMSSGMLASAKELDLFDDHAGIMEIDKELQTGTRFAAAYELDDYLLDIENKSLTHRPDAFGVIGFAREVAAIQGIPFVSPEWLLHDHPTYGSSSQTVASPTVSIDDQELSARYQAVIVSGADSTRTSPLEIQTYLARVGVRPINAVVDVTNYLMMLTGQPLHAFDYDKLVAVSGGSADIHVRAARQQETLVLLDGRTIEMTPDDIVIAAGETAIGLAGAMGGANTTIDDNTKNIIIESATFNLYKLRGTQMRHGIFSEAITRFTKGQPAELTAPVLAEALDLMAQWSGATRASDVVEANGHAQDISSIALSLERVNATLGTDLSSTAVQDILRSVEFAVMDDGNETLSVYAPYWRADIHIAEDIIEEIGRIAGYDSIVPRLPKRDFTAVAPNEYDQFRTRLRRLLVRAGANEVLTYSFIHGDILQKAGQHIDDSYRIINSISPDLQYYRQTLTPNLLGLVHANVKQGYGNFALFEMNKTHAKSHGVNTEGLPVESEMVGLVLSRSQREANAPYYIAKQFIDFVASSLNVVVHYDVSTLDTALSAPFEPKRSAVISSASGTVIGVVGEYRRSVAKAFKLSESAAGFEIDAKAFYQLTVDADMSYTPLHRYPSSERDICFQVSSEIAYRDVITATHSAINASEIEVVLTPVDLYQPKDGQTKNITVRVRMTARDKTLTGGDVSAVVQQIIDRVTLEIHATVI